MIRALVAESFPIMRDALCAALARDQRFHALGGHGSGRSALAALTGRRADAVLLDLALPDIGGADLVRRVRVASPDAHVLVFVSQREGAALRAALDAGAHGYVPREGGIGEVLDAISSACGGPNGVGVVAGSVAAATEENGRDMGGGTRLQLRDGDLELIARVVNGQTDHEIAQGLYVSARTVQNHLARIRRAAGVARRPELARWAIENALV